MGNGFGPLILWDEHNVGFIQVLWNIPIPEHLLHLFSN